MNIASFKQFSILGIVLVAASAVTAAVVPSKSKSAKPAFLANGKLQITATPFGVANEQTCKMVTGTVATCHDTVTADDGSKTTLVGQTSNTLTAGNTVNTTIPDPS